MSGSLSVKGGSHQGQVRKSRVTEIEYFLLRSGTDVWYFLYQKYALYGSMCPYSGIILAIYFYGTQVCDHF